MTQPPPPGAPLGLIGCGKVGRGLARLAVAAGLDIVLSNSRGPESLAGLVAELGPRARAGTPAEAARAGGPVVVAVPLRAHGRLPVAELAGRTVVDLMNYRPEADGVIAELDSGALTPSGLLQRHLAASRVVKVYLDVDFRRLRPAFELGPLDRSTLPVAGTDQAAKEEVTRLLYVLGYDVLDVGTFENSRVLAELSSLYERARATARVMAEKLEIIPPDTPGHVEWPAALAPAAVRGRLAPQEQRVMALTAAGYSLAEVAREMFLSEKTVKNYLSRIYRKLGVRSRSQAILQWLGHAECAVVDSCA